MTPDELRALADALEPMSGAPRFEGMNVLAFCKWLRAQAEYATANGLRMLQQDDATVLLYKHDYLIRPDHVPLYAHPAPAVPQAEPDDDDDALVLGEPDILTPEDLRRLVPQAEPKPLGDWRIAEEATNRQMTAACEDAFYDGVRWAESAHGIGGSDAE